MNKDKVVIKKKKRKGNLYTYTYTYTFEFSMLIPWGPIWIFRRVEYYYYYYYYVQFVIDVDLRTSMIEI